MCNIATVARVIAFITGLGGSAAAFADNLLLNPSAENGKGKNPSIWSRAMIEADGLVMERDATAAKSGKYSLMIANSHDYEKPTANNWMQVLQKVPRGATLQL